MEMGRRLFFCVRAVNPFGSQRSLRVNPERWRQWLVMEPTRATAGSTLSWERVIADYSADDSYRAVYYLRNAEHTPAPIICTGSGTTHTAAVTIAESGKWKAGIYQWTLFAELVVDSEVTERYEIDRGEIEVLASVTSGAPVDGRSFAARMVEKLEVLLLKVADNPATSLSISTPGGTSRSKSFQTLEEVQRALTKYRNALRAEKDAQRIRAGKKSRRIHTTTFTG